MGSVVKTIVASGTTFNIDELINNPGHSVTIRSNADTSSPFATTTTFSFVSGKSFGAGTGFCGESGLGSLGICADLSPFVVTLAPNESWEVRYIGDNGLVNYFSVKRSFTPMLPIANVKFQNSLTSALGFTFAGTATTTDKVITLPDANVDLGRNTSYTAATSNITPPASTVAHQNTTAFDYDVLITGGVGVTLIEFSRNGSTWFDTGSLSGFVPLSPNDRVRVTYSTTAPTMTKIPR
jgi:hypothetical protein